MLVRIPSIALCLCLSLIHKHFFFLSLSLFFFLNTVFVLTSRSSRMCTSQPHAISAETCVTTLQDKFIDFRRFLVKKIAVCLPVCCFVKGTHAENSHIVLSCPCKKPSRSYFNLFCVLTLWARLCFCKSAWHHDYCVAPRCHFEHGTATVEVVVIIRFFNITDAPDFSVLVANPRVVPVCWWKTRKW